MKSQTNKEIFEKIDTLTDLIEMTQMPEQIRKKLENKREELWTLLAAKELGDVLVLIVKNVLVIPL